MRLSNLITPADGAFLSGPDKDIVGVTADSRKVKEGYLFIAVPGTQKDGSTFIPDAIARGATAVLMSKNAPEAQKKPASVTFVTTENVRSSLACVASRFYPRQPQLVAAVTGTSGKTSTVQFTRELWELAGHRAASLGTLGLIAPGVNHYGALTTPDSVLLHKDLDQAAGFGVTHLAMEASSHGIELNRLDCVEVSIAAFTNLSRDHLDYHETMERYLAAKLRLFTDLLKADGHAVLNADVPEYEPIKAACEARKLHILSFGKNGLDVKLINARPDSRGQRLRLEILGRPYDILLPLIGGFQAFNSLCALTIALASGEPSSAAVQSLASLSGVPGRLQFVGRTPAGGSVFVDYAHKPGALEHVLGTLRPHVAAVEGARLHVVFGCGGNRDKGKRPLMGEIAQRLADVVIVTDDNPRHEEAAPIRKEILAGCKLSEAVREIGDRAEAIRVGIKGLGAGDVLVIAGKGHEEGQIVGDEVLPFNDAAVACQIIEEMERKES